MVADLIDTPETALMDGAIGSADKGVFALAHGELNVVDQIVEIQYDLTGQADSHERTAGLLQSEAITNRQVGHMMRSLVEQHPIDAQDLQSPPTEEANKYDFAGAELVHEATRHRRAAGELRKAASEFNTKYRTPVNNANERLGKGVISRRLLPLIAFASIGLGVAAGHAVPREDGPVVRDDSFLPGNWGADFMPIDTGFDDPGHIRVTTERIEVPVEQDSNDISVASEEKFRIIITTDDIGHVAVSQSSPDFRLTDDVYPASVTASEAMLNELEDAIAEGATVEYTGNIGTSSDEASGVDARLGVPDEGNESAAEVRSIAGADAWSDASFDSPIADELPEHDVDFEEVILEPEQKLDVEKLADKYGLSLEDFMAQYKQGTIDLAVTESEDMFAYIDANRGNRYEAIVSFKTSELISEGDPSPAPLKTETRTIETAAIRSGTSTKELAAFLGTAYSAFFMVLGSAATKLPRRMIRNRARKELGDGALNRLKSRLKDPLSDNDPDESDQLAT